MTYCQPDRLRTVVVEGKPMVERVPGSPTREAYAHEVNVWYETIEDNDSPK
jgi:hypothetical protein